MTPRERTHAIFHRKTPDRLPKEIKLTPPLLKDFKKRTGSDDPYEHFGLDVREVYIAQPAEFADFSPYYPNGVPPLWNPAGWEVGEWGVGSTPGDAFHFIHIEHPMLGLQSVEDLKRYPFPDYTPSARWQHLKAEVEALHERGLFVIGFMEWTIFEIAWHMRGMDNLFMDVLFNQDFARYLLDRITEIRCFQATKYAEAGVDLIKIGDDLGTQRGLLMSREMYKEWFWPGHAAVVAAARKVCPDMPVCYHSDGNCWDVIRDLIDAGVTILNPLQPECLDLAAVRREFGKDLMFWGAIGTQTTMPFAKPDEVYETVQQTIDVLGPTGYFPSPTHVLEPEVPWENIE
ncbi:MAG TPA: uroporphyrinogen decarboxylase family protein, partial [Fimbriimonadaceae bacterium]|nr:uroporphyrinogen decarboxylase family protein [Fimbriimonadaceae bacterium]